MNVIGKYVAAVATATMLVSCVRFELDGESELDVDVAQSAQRISGEDAVVLCPLAATVEASGAVSIVWAGYPEGDDRLQLMHARVSSTGHLLLQPHGLAELDNEVARLSITALSPSQGAVIEVLLVERDASELLQVSVGETFQVTGYNRDELPADTVEEMLENSLRSSESEHCLETVFTSEARLQIRRTQVDGELPLFVESFSL